MNKAYLLEPLIHGGGQEQGLRSGTENVVSLLGAAEACRVAKVEMEPMYGRMIAFKQLLVDKLNLIVPNLRINGTLDSTYNLANTLNIAIPGVRGGVSRLFRSMFRYCCFCWLGLQFKP